MDLARNVICFFRETNMKRFFFGASALVLMTGTAFAQVTVDWLNIETNEGILAIMEQAAREYETLNPDITINMQFLENEAFKAKLTTLLQSDAAPDIFYSWGGGVMSEQQSSGVLRSITGLVSDEKRAQIGDAGINAFSRDGELYGFAERVEVVGFWGNKELLAQASVTPQDMQTWDDFLASVQKIKDAGITPIALGGQDKWPVHFYWSYLVVRMAGQDEFAAARLNEGDGFAGDSFVKAGQMFADLVAIEPFQPGFLAANYGDASGLFGDGGAALHLMGNWDYNVSRTNSASGEGLSDDNMVFIPFPSVNGGKGDPSSTLGGISGWIFARDASDEAVEFMNWYQSPQIQQRFAAEAAYIPIIKGGTQTLENKFFRVVADFVNTSKWHAIFFDQTLGADVGGVVNDISVELAAQSITPLEAAELVKEAVEDAQ